MVEKNPSNGRAGMVICDGVWVVICYYSNGGCGGVVVEKVIGMWLLGMLLMRCCVWRRDSFVHAASVR